MWWYHFDTEDSEGKTEQYDAFFFEMFCIQEEKAFRTRYLKKKVWPD